MIWSTICGDCVCDNDHDINHNNNNKNKNSRRGVVRSISLSLFSMALLLTLYNIFHSDIQIISLSIKSPSTTTTTTATTEGGVPRTTTYFAETGSFQDGGITPNRINNKIFFGGHCPSMLEDVGRCWQRSRTQAPAVLQTWNLGQSSHHQHHSSREIHF
jgi:hypothetical protein